MNIFLSGMKAFGITTLLLFALLSSALSQESVNQSDDKGRKQGVWTKSFESGQERYRGQFKNDKPVGTFFYYYEDGAKSSEVVYVGEDGVESNAKFFHKNSTVMGEGKYINQQKVGVWKYYDDQTILSSVEPYKAGKLHGVSKVYFLNGKVAAETPYIDGLKTGAFTEYFSDGAVKIQGTYRDNTYDGDFVQFYADGKKMVEGQYVAAVKDGLWQYYADDGRLKAQQVYEKGEMVKERIEEGFEAKEVPMELKEEDKMDEQQLIDDYHKQTEEGK